jgi:hypothetical protein
MKNTFKITSASFIFISIITLSSFSGCEGTDNTPTPVVKEPISIVFNSQYNGEDLVYNKLYKSPQNNDLWIIKKEYYLSNVIAISKSGSKELVTDIVLLDQSEGINGMTVSGSIPKGDYTAIEFSLGVREDLNLKDPATFDASHPLSVTNNMYWGWSTQYIFSKLEGFEIYANDTTSFVIHTGTQDLYRPEINVSRAFSITTGGNTVNVTMDVFDILEQNEYTFNLITDGQSHTVDNLPLATQYMDNFTKAFK